MLRFVVLITLVFAVGPVAAGDVSEASSASKKPGETPPLVGESCFGDSNEKDADLLTGNEALVHELLQQMLSPGS